MRVVDGSDDAEPRDSVWGAPWTASRSRYLAHVSILIVAGLASMLIDVPLARALHKDKALHRLHGFLESIEPFGQPTAIVMTALAIALCDVRRRRLMPRLLVASLGAGLTADFVKLFVSRTRPHHHDLAGSVLASFQQLIPGLGVGSRFQSFPSAHTATAVGFCLALSTLFPQGSRLFVAAAGLVALQRVEAGAHFLSDTCWGAAVGYAVCLLVFHRDLLGTWFDRKERPGTSTDEENATPTRERFSVVSVDE